MKNTQSKTKPIKVGRQSGTTYCFGCKDYTKYFRPEKVKMTNKILRAKSHCIIWQSNKSRLQINNLITYKNKMKTYCVKCKKDNENIDQKQLEQKMIELLCNQNVLFVEVKNQNS